MTADHALDELGFGIQLGRRKELLEGRAVLDVLLDLRLREAGQLLENLQEVFLGVPLPLDLLEVERICGVEPELSEKLVGVVLGCHRVEWGGPAGLANDS